MSILTNHYVLSFIKFAILATLGEIIACSIKNKKFTIPHSIVARMLIWGLLGVWIAFMMGIFAESMAGKLTKAGVDMSTFFGTVIFGFVTSLVMNVCFGPVFMVFHKHTDVYLDLRHQDKNRKISFKDISDNVDYYAYAKNVLWGTIPTFWLPAHTITFMIPADYRVLFAAFLSICLGIILSLKS